MKEMPRLDLAPKLNRPLQLWNPLDYLRLLYWVFYFPQALEHYCSSSRDSVLKDNEIDIPLIPQKIVKQLFLLSRSKSIRNLSINTILLCFILIFLELLVKYFLESPNTLDFPRELFDSFGTALLISTAYFLFIVFFNEIDADSIFMVIVFSVFKAISQISIIILDALLELQFAKLKCTIFSLRLGIMTGLFLSFKAREQGVAFLSDPSAKNSLLLSSFIFLVGLTESLFSTYWITYSTQEGGVAAFLPITAYLCTLSLLFFVFRVDDFLIYFLFLRKKDTLSHVTPIPVVSASKAKILIGKNWKAGLNFLNDANRYTNQQISFRRAAFYIIGESEEKHLLKKISDLSVQEKELRFLEYTFYDNRREISALGKILVAYSEKKETLKNTLKKNNEEYTPEESSVIESFFSENEKKFQILDSQRENVFTPYILLLGFASLHYAKEYYGDINRGAIIAKNLFGLHRHILYGEEMYIIAANLGRCSQAKKIEQIPTTEIQPCPEPDPTKRLRQNTWPALEAFHRITQDAQLIHQSRSKATQNTALSRALGELKTILDHQDQLPQAEGGLIIDIATTWRDALLSIASDIGNIEIIEPITNPYTIGDPVEGNRFVGREDLLRELESLWLGAENPSSVLVYGHRRMGKTSLLRNLTGGSDLKLIYVNLQLLGSVSQGLSEVLLAIADDIAQAIHIPAPPDDAFLNFPQRTFERYLRNILNQLDSRALIIALDEFEIIEDLIEAGQLSPDFMGYLRGLIQMDKRLAFALAGLHTLEEMTRDYFQPFFGSTYGLRVSFLTEAATRQILENPSDDFPLEYEPTAIDEIYRLTHGQPYLLQLIGFQLVRRFNEQVFETGREREPRLTPTDVKAITDISQADLFRNGRYYFEGVWNQAAQGSPSQQAILKALAPHPDGLTLPELQTQLPHLDNLTAALDTLARHDAIQPVPDQPEDRYCITVELFRIWCERLAPGSLS